MTSMAELREIIADLAKRQAETSRSLDRLEKTVEELSLAADKRSAEADKRSVEADRRLEKLEKLYGGVSENSGRHAEEFFQNAMRKTLTFGGIKFDKLIPNLAVTGGDNCEFDIALVNGDTVALMEAKNRIHPEFVNELATKKLAQFRKLFPEYGNYSVYLGVAGFSFDKTVYAEAKKYGVGVVRQDGDSVQVDAGCLKVY